ncbi:MAG: fatty acid kinase fatty acid binding subunit [Gaiellaceae bacterium]|nr:fatty acid kinase fatty acid binding subunit [Gaiellaceae bacterium]
MNLTAQNTAIVLDSTADFPDAQERFPNWRVVPLYVNFGTESFKDGVDLTAEQFYERLTRSPELPTTSQPTPGDFLSVYEELGSYERILSVHLAAKLSGTLQSAGTAAQQLGDGRVRTIDSQSASVAVSMLALAMQRRLERGTTDEEIDALVERYTREHGLLFTVDTLEFLARGGRIGRAKAFAGQLMNVKPILSIRDGEVLPVKRVRGNRKAFQEFVDALETQTRDEPGLRVGIAHAAAPERMIQIEKMVRDKRPQAEIEMETMLGAVIGAHAGPGTVGFFWFDDPSGP